MADEKFSAKFDVKASALPDRILKDFENVKHPSAIKLLPVTKAQELPQEKNKSNGLTMLELNQFVSDPFWVKIRRTLMVFAILLFLGLFIASILIIVYTPSCIDGKNATQANSTSETLFGIFCIILGASVIVIKGMKIHAKDRNSSLEY